jgi:hypothetical protein
LTETDPPSGNEPSGLDEAARRARDAERKRLARQRLADESGFAGRIEALENARTHAVDQASLDAKIDGLRAELLVALAEDRGRVAKAESEFRDFLVRAERAHVDHIREVQRVFLLRLSQADDPDFRAKVAQDARSGLREIERERSTQGGGEGPPARGVEDA